MTKEYDYDLGVLRLLNLAKELGTQNERDLDSAIGLISQARSTGTGLDILAVGQPESVIDLIVQFYLDLGDNAAMASLDVPDIASIETVGTHQLHLVSQVADPGLFMFSKQGDHDVYFTRRKQEV